MSALEGGEILQAACCLVALDDRATASEMRVLLRLADSFGIGKATVELFLHQAAANKQYYATPFSFLKPEAEQTIKTLIRVAASDGAISQSESVIIQYFARKLGMKEERLISLLDRANRQLHKAR